MSTVNRQEIVKRAYWKGDYSSMAELFSSTDWEKELEACWTSRDYMRWMKLEMPLKILRNNPALRQIKGNNKGKQDYQKVLQEDSDSELPLCEDEKVLFKKTGEIEFNLYPETRIHRPLMETSVNRKLIVCTSIVFVLTTVAIAMAFFIKTNEENDQNLKVNNGSNGASVRHRDPPVLPKVEKLGNNIDGWRATFIDTMSEGGMRLLDVNGDHIEDIIFTSANVKDIMTRSVERPWPKIFNDTKIVCKAMDMDYPCIGQVMAINGSNGAVLWHIYIRSEAFNLNCEDFDFNLDHKKDCIAVGRLATVAAFDPYKGEVIWMAEHDDFMKANWNTFTSGSLPDWDNDGVPEVLIANGGDTSKNSKDHNREAGRLLVLSGASGRVFGTRYLEMPNNKETYMTPVFYKPRQNGTTYILFGSGGETIPGDFMGISLGDLCKYVMEGNSSFCPQEKEYKDWDNLKRDDNGIFVIYSDKEKGSMVPPVIADFENDGVDDVVLSMFDGYILLLNGTTMEQVWSANFSGMESYSTPATGYFDNDSYLDLMMHWNKGAWNLYSSSNVTVLSGKDGTVLWTLNSAAKVMSSDLSLSQTEANLDTFLFTVLGRESIYRWNENGNIIRPVKNLTERKKRHSDMEEPPEGGHPIAIVSLADSQLKQRLLTCDEDLTSFYGEVLMIDRNTVMNPHRLLKLPLMKYEYEANPTCTRASSQSQHPHNKNQTTIPVQRNNDKQAAVRKCAVSNMDKSATGVIGDVDGDGNLDLVIVFINSFPLFDAKNCAHAGINEMLLYKVSFEKALKEGKLEQVTVKAETVMNDAGAQETDGTNIFLPLAKQKWTQYMGSHGNSLHSVPRT